MFSNPSQSAILSSGFFCWNEITQPLDARIGISSQSSTADEKKNVDIIVKDGKKFTVNLHILTANSDYFRRLFFNPEHRVPSPIVLDEVTSSGFRAFLNSINDDKLDIKMDNVEDLLIVSRYLILPRIVNSCMQFLLTQIKDHWLEILELVNNYSLFVVGFELQNFLLNNFEEIATDTDKFGEMPYEILFSLAQDPRINISSEFKLFKLVVKWINFRFEERADYFDCFLTAIRLPLMSQDELEEVAMYFNPLVYSPGHDMVKYLLNAVASWNCLFHIYFCFRSKCLSVFFPS